MCPMQELLGLTNFLIGCMDLDLLGQLAQAGYRRHVFLQVLVSVDSCFPLHCMTCSDQSARARSKQGAGVHW